MSEIYGNQFQIQFQFQKSLTKVLDNPAQKKHSFVY